MLSLRVLKITSETMLIDTSALIWYGLEPNLLSKRATRLMGGGGNFYSHVSLWEMAIKSGLGETQAAHRSGATYQRPIIPANDNS